MNLNIPGVSPDILRGVERFLRQVLSFPWRLWRVATASLPTASTDNEGGLLYDETTSRIAYSDGSAWIGLQPYDAAVASIAALSIVQGDILYGDAADSVARLAKNTTATRYLSNTGTSNNPAWAQVDLTNGVTGDLPFANIAQISTARVLGRTTSGTGDIEQLTITGTGNVVFSAAPTLTGTVTISAGDLQLDNARALYGKIAAGNATRLINLTAADAMQMGSVDQTVASISFISGGTTWALIASTRLNLMSGMVYQIAGTQVVTSRRTGWGAATGTATRSAIATYSAPTISSPPTQAEVQAIADALQAWSRRGKALSDDLITHGLIGT